ncbi:MAG: class I SAM-dependent methyltransferase [Candidatus Helarchaeota archaeon]
MEIKLNLGCGNNYKPGYINIDKFNKNLADKICDIENLPFKNNSVDLIEALQLIEHFDYIHCKYVLSEWFRVLKPNGVLIIETPDLVNTCKKFVSQDLESNKSTLNWIYGIDSKGLQHKSGFSFDSLKNLLKEIGFENIIQEKQKTHTYEHGLRIICKKPQTYDKHQLFAVFRKNLKKNLNIDDSYFLIPLEDAIEKIFKIFFNEKKRKLEYLLDEIIAKTAIYHPIIPLTFIDQCVNVSFIDKSEMIKKISILKNLNKIELHKKLFTLWIKNRKDPGKSMKNYKNFVKNIEKIIIDSLNYSEDFNERLKYILDLKPRNIELMNITLILLQAEKFFNLGLKHYTKKEFLAAMDYFIRSKKLYPDNYLIYWNLARISSYLKLNCNVVINYYETAIFLADDDKVTAELKRELIKFKNNKLIPNTPMFLE